MKKAKLHHLAVRIAPHSLEKVIELFGLLGCKLSYRPEEGIRWAMVAQDNLSFDIQLCEVSGPPDQGSKRIESHIGFISPDPDDAIQKLADWAMANSIEYKTGQWDPTMLWIDFPTLFLDFAIEIMHTSTQES